MKSGAPAFGTPEHVKATLGSGQLARHIGLNWRSAAGCAGNAADAQAAHETEISMWAAVMANATMILHTAGWLEGGLTHSFEKFITDTDMIRIFAELCGPTVVDKAEMAFEAIREVQPGGHFFAAGHTMERFHTAFYEPISWDLSNHGTWEEAGALSAEERATATWQARLAQFEAPPKDAERLAQLDAFIAQRTAEGGAPPGE
jgi:trimethylamine--corrinoid protein Co-methyltransferase